MANLGALNKMLKIQRILLSLNVHNNTAFSSCYGTLTSKVLYQSKQPQLQQKSKQTWSKVLIERKSALTVTATAADRCRRHTSTTATINAKSIDEFREREEKLEKEYAEQLVEEERRQKSKTENNAEDEAKRAKVNEVRTKILEAALLHVPSLGWSRNAIVRGAEEVGLPSVVHGMFPEGGYALVSYFYSKCNEQLVSKMQAETQNGQEGVSDPPDFVLRAIRSRLEMVLPFKSQWPQALALMAAPQNASTALALVLTLVDDICYYAGDRSVDMRWYARRIGVATIMKMTELFMLQDSSPENVKTWEFLKTRLDEATRLQSLLQSTEGVTHNFQRSFNSAFETARNILGIGYQRR